MKKKFRRVLLFFSLSLMGVCLVGAGLSAGSNLNLPTHSQVADRLSDLEKARLAEAIHLRQALGDTVWAGWGLMDIPLIVYNEDYAFLLGYPNPPEGWMKMPQKKLRGGPWEVVPDDDFEGQAYYRQQLTDPDLTPENFAVLVGERWVATLATKEYAEIDFYAGLRAELPLGVRSIFPYRLMWGLIMGETDTYIGALDHETFHAFQGSLVASRLEAAETANQSESQYPWDNRALDEAWKTEMDLLVKAVRASSNAEALELIRQFLIQRDERRAALGLTPELVNYERQREWLEGLAKYAELSLGRLAATTPGYAPLPDLVTADPAFKAYTTREQYWSGQLDEARRTAGREGEVRFYYSGLAQAAILDRLLPGWKEQAFNTDVMLEDLLREAVVPQ